MRRGQLSRGVVAPFDAFRCLFLVLVRRFDAACGLVGAARSCAVVLLL